MHHRPFTLPPRGISIAPEHFKFQIQTSVRGELILFKKTFAVLLSVMILATSFAFQSVQAQTRSSTAAKARLKVESLASDARVEVKLLDGTKLKGVVSTKDQDSFTVTDRKTGASSVVRYAEVAEVKKSGGGFSTKSWIILGSVVAGVVITWIIVKPVFCDGGAQTRGIC
jgi:hypothetical protein